MTSSRPPVTLTFFALTFLVTEPCFVAAAWLARGHAPDTPPGLGANALVLLGTFAPALVALALTARAEGRDGVRALLGRLFRWKVGARWYAFALLYMIGVKLFVAVLARLSTGAWPSFGATPFARLIAATLFSTVVGGQAGEEIGWRGYALPRLAARLGLGGASLVLGVIWALWHLPVFYLRGADTFGQSFPAYLLQVVAMSVAMAWLYGRTNGSLTLTMLMHAAINNTKDIVPSVARAPANPLRPEASLTSWLGLAVLWAIALALLVRMRRAASPDGGA
jgi:membrane protease YdiL (CAAX protease family)